MRARVKGITRSTASQQTRRMALTSLSARWSAILTEDQRTAWTAYAAATPSTNKLGDSIILTGSQAYMMVNGVRLVGGLAIVDTAPVGGGMAEAPVATATASAGTGMLSVAEPSAGFTKATTGDVMLVYCSRPRPAGRAAKGKTLIYVGKVTGSTGTPPTFPQTFTLPAPLVTGQRVTVQLQHCEPTVKVSPRTTIEVVGGA